MMKRIGSLTICIGNMKKSCLLFIITFLAFSSYGKIVRNSYYITNQAPLVAQPYTALPFGAIKQKECHCFGKNKGQPLTNLENRERIGRKDTFPIFFKARS